MSSFLLVRKVGKFLDKKTQTFPKIPHKNKMTFVACIPALECCLFVLDFENKYFKLFWIETLTLSIVNEQYCQIIFFLTF